MQWTIKSAAASALLLWSGAAMAMADYKWTKRPLIVFADSEDDVKLVRQRRVVEDHRAALAERDVVVVWVVRNSTSADLGSAANVQAPALRSRYRVSGGAFRAILIGKDGGVKLSSSLPINAETLIRTIDAMPMRREEMRRK